MSPDLEAYLFDRIPRAARDVQARFPMVERADLEQEMWMRAVVSADQFARDLPEHPEFIWRHLKDTGHRYGVKDDQARRVRKAARTGYKIDDEFFYSPKMVGMLVAELIQAEWDTSFAMERATKGSSEGVRVQGGDDTHDAFIDYLALLLDVKAAYDRLNRAQQHSLTAWYGEGDDDESPGDRQAIAASMGLSYKALDMRKGRALRALLRDLGGESPYGENRPSGEKAELSNTAHQNFSCFRQISDYGG